MVDVDVVTIPTAQFASFFLESLLFGIFIVLYGITVWILLHRQATISNRIQLVASTTMLALAAAHLGLSTYRAYEGFIRSAGTPSGSNAFLSDTRKATSVAKLALYVTQTFAGDAFMAYRVYVIWNYDRYIAILPAILSIGVAVTGYIACYDMSATDFFQLLTTTAKAYGPASLTVFLALACVSNVIATVLVILRIVRSNRRVRNYGTVVIAERRNVLEVFIQSAAIYSTVLIAFFVTYAAGVNPEMFGVDVLTPLIGVVFTLIIIRLGLGQTTRERRGEPIHVVSWRRSSVLPVHRRRSSEAQEPLRITIPPPTRRSLLKRGDDARLKDNDQSSSVEDHGYLLPSIKRLDLDDLMLDIISSR